MRNGWVCSLSVLGPIDELKIALEPGGRIRSLDFQQRPDFVREMAALVSNAWPSLPLDTSASLPSHELGLAALPGLL